MSTYKPTEKINYIDNKIENGIKIDWNKVRKEFKKLNIPSYTHNPLKCDIENCGYIIDISDRSRGKTTNKLIIGLILYKLYGITLQYIRCRSSSLRGNEKLDLYKTVTENGYIEKIFGKEYNGIINKSRRWYLCKFDETGEIIEQNTESNTVCIGLDESDLLKSTYNAPRGDMIFFDEFIETHYGLTDFVRFADIVKTIVRDRVSSVIFMSSNNINLNSPWFDEFCIRNEIEHMKQGDSKYIVSELGTHIYLEILGEDTSDRRIKSNRRFFGFRNPKLISITGRGEWATETFPHIPTYGDEDTPPEILQNNVFIKLSGKYVKLKLVNDSKIGVCVFVTPATKIYGDSIILTSDEITNKNEIYGIGTGTIFDIYWKLYMSNLFFFSRNSEGAFVKSYLSYAHSCIINKKGR
jgi:hypothetical protein